MRYYSQQRGSISIAALLMIPAILAMGAIAIDVSQQLRFKARLADAAEAAALAVAQRNADSLTEDSALAQFYLNAYFTAGDAPVLDEVVNLGNGYQVNAHADVSALLVNDFFASASDSTPVTTSAAAGSSSGGSVAAEIALVLDMSGSMNGQKYNELKAATREVVDLAGGDFYVALVPFSKGSSVINMPWNAGTTNQKSCVPPFSPFRYNSWSGSYETQYYNFSTGVPAAMVNHMFDVPNLPRPYDRYDWSGGPWLVENCAINVITPLSNDKAVLNAAIDAWQVAEGSSTTASLYGYLWGARILAPSWDGQWGAITPAGVPKDYGDTEKYLIILTDGGDSGAWGYSLRDLVNAGMCTEMVSRGIKLRYIGYRYAGWSTGFETYHQNCVGSENMQRPADLAALKQAFADAIDAAPAESPLTLIDPI